MRRSGQFCDSQFARICADAFDVKISIFQPEMPVQIYNEAAEKEINLICYEKHFVLLK